MKWLTQQIRLSVMISTGVLQLTTTLQSEQQSLGEGHQNEQRQQQALRLGLNCSARHHLLVLLLPQCYSITLLPASARQNCISIGGEVRQTITQPSFEGHGLCFGVKLQLTRDNHSSFKRKAHNHSEHHSSPCLSLAVETRSSFPIHLPPLS